MTATAYRRVEELPDLLTRSELAEFTGISISTLATWAVEKKGPPLLKLGHAARYRKQQVLEWLESSAQEAR